ncbi:hypothetical protein FB107DRAFT_294122 [Schizophyllum commune]
MSTEETIENSHKRQRTEEPQRISTATRHQEHWNRDGSIILHVEDTLFRIHQTTLERLSEVFKDLFSVPQPPGEERVDECPVVRLEGDQSADWIHLLDAIYDPLHFDELALQEPKANLARLSAILRLSTKYRITAFRRKAIAIFSKNFQSGDTYIPQERTMTVNEVYTMINLARSTNALTLLPFAFMLLTSLRSPEVINGAPISNHDKLVIFRGMLRLLSARDDDLFPFAHSFNPPDGCIHPELCSTAIGRFLIAQFRQRSHSSFFFLSDKFTFQWAANMCETCLNHIQTTFRSGRQKTWERLPFIFGLGKDWEELRRIEAYDSMP